jgi:hypothetical protein
MHLFWRTGAGEDLQLQSGPEHLALLLLTVRNKTKPRSPHISFFDTITGDSVSVKHGSSSDDLYLLNNQLGINIT